MEKEKSTKNSTAPSSNDEEFAEVLRAMTEANKEGDMPEARELHELMFGEEK